MDVMTKSVDAPVMPVESDNPNGEFEVVLSTETLDRDGEHLWIDEWKQPLPARIHIDGDHTMTIEKTVGSVVPRIEGNRLIGKGTYAPTPYAQMVREIVGDTTAEGHAISLSVTYSEKKNHKDGKPQRELLNAAFVAVGANPDAVVLSSKAAKTEGKPVGTVYVDVVPRMSPLFALLKQLDASGDNPEVRPEHMVQAIHDAAVQLGSQCTDHSGDEDDGASKNAESSRITQKSASPPAGPPQQSADESAATDTAADEAAVSAAADESAEDAAKQAAGVRARSLAFLTKRHTEQD